MRSPCSTCLILSRDLPRKQRNHRRVPPVGQRVIMGEVVPGLRRTAMKTILVTVGDGSATPLLATALLAATRFGRRITGLNALTTEYAVVFGGEMGFSVSAEVDRTLEREGQDRREQARTLFTSFMEKQGVPMGGGPMGGGPPESGPSAEWREESGRQNAVVGLIGRVFDLIAVERPAKLASLAEATLED